MTPGRARMVLILAGLYNLLGGLVIIFLLDVVAPLVDFEPAGNMLFRLFAGGTAVTFGIAYFHLARSATYRTALLIFGTGLKYWAFVAALVCYLFFGLSLAMLLLFGVANLGFALLFTLVLLDR